MRPGRGQDPHLGDKLQHELFAFEPGGQARLDGNIPDDGLKAVIEQGIKESKTTRAIGASDVADLIPLREARKELGMKPR